MRRRWSRSAAKIRSCDSARQAVLGGNSGFDVQKPHRSIHITPDRRTEPQPSHGPVGTTTATQSHQVGSKMASPGNMENLSGRAFFFSFSVPFVIMPIASLGRRTGHVMRYIISCNAPQDSNIFQPNSLGPDWDLALVTK